MREHPGGAGGTLGEGESAWNQPQDHPSPCRVDILQLPMGRDIVFMVSGGEAHIGASATASLSAEGVMVEVSVVPGHREGELAGELAELAARRLGCTVTVIAGIHVDRPSREDIEAIVQEARARMREQLDEMAGLGAKTLKMAPTARK
ncbi:hypothetical protein [Paenibacillus sambharensis]|uniref:prenylated flavin chaperone LpdD n=1 Tax=Paenibacillus sambharensis TaxID=1803190 RepID=UPI0015E88140|nr:hypothetical protein [Paenibacillus sambharensis]